MVMGGGGRVALIRSRSAVEEARFCPSATGPQSGGSRFVEEEEDPALLSHNGFQIDVCFVWLLDV